LNVKNFLLSKFSGTLLCTVLPKAMGITWHKH
jgi:hypothetical protein